MSSVRPMLGPRAAGRHRLANGGVPAGYEDSGSDNPVARAAEAKDAGV